MDSGENKPNPEKSVKTPSVDGHRFIFVIVTCKPHFYTSTFHCEKVLMFSKVVYSNIISSSFWFIKGVCSSKLQHKHVIGNIYTATQVLLKCLRYLLSLNLFIKFRKIENSLFSWAVLSSMINVPWKNKFWYFLKNCSI